jgi:hypothetical protein
VRCHELGDVGEVLVPPGPTSVRAELFGSRFVSANGRFGAGALRLCCPSSGVYAHGRPATRRETQQISLGDTLTLRRDQVTTTPADPTTGTGHRRRTSARASGERLTALHLRWPPRCTYGVLQTRPDGSPSSAHQAALGTAPSIPSRTHASSILDSPCQGSRSGLPPPISNVCASTHIVAPAELLTDVRTSANHNPSRPTGFLTFSSLALVCSWID